LTAGTVIQDDSISLARDYGVWATELLRVADANKNGRLSTNEMTTMLAGTEHQGFVEWLFFHRNENFRKEDKDMSGSLEWEELTLALYHFHNHVKNGESLPLSQETDLMLVARNLIEVSDMALPD
jgi:Ca2+-binding EF-hand superfamily protein